MGRYSAETLQKFDASQSQIKMSNSPLCPNSNAVKHKTVSHMA